MVVSNYIYLIRNKDLYKIGITKNISRRMKVLKPDLILKVTKTNQNVNLEKRLHHIYKDVRIPQTEYFRLNRQQVSNCIKHLSEYSIRRSKCMPGVIGLAVGLISPMMSIFWGIRQRSFKLGLMPIAMVFLANLIYSNDTFDKSSNLIIQIGGGIIAFMIAQENKNKAL